MSSSSTVDGSAITTMPGVLHVGDGPGHIELIRSHPGDTVVDLRVSDHTGATVTVHIGYREIVELMVRLGREAYTL